VICRKVLGSYEPMKYYTAIGSIDVRRDENVVGFGDGYFILNDEDRYDFFPIDEFNNVFLLVDERLNKIDNILFFLKNTRHFDIEIEPVIICDGYFYKYNIHIVFPFAKQSILEYDFPSFTEAAKRVINIAREACLEKHAKDGIGFWLAYSFVKKS
jgi:hypothetical protein